MAAPKKPTIYCDFIPTPDGRMAVARASIAMLGIERLSDNKWELRMLFPSGNGRPGQLDNLPIGVYDTEAEAVKMLAFVAQGEV